MKKRPTHPWFLPFARVAVSVLLLGVLLWQVELQRVIDHLQHLSLGFVLFAWGYYAFCQLLSSYRWQMFLRVKDIRVPLPSLFVYYMIGGFLNNFLPGAVGGDAAKAYYVYRRSGEGHYALSSVFLDRFSGLLGLSLLSLVALGFGLRWLDSPVILAAVGGTALFLFAVVLALWWAPLSAPIRDMLGRLWPSSLGPRLQELYAALGSYRQHPGVLLRATLLSAAIQGLYALYYGLVAWGIGIAIDVYYFLLFLPLVSLAILVPVSFTGWGVREALFVFLFGEVGVEAADILAVSLTANLLSTLLTAYGGLLWMGQRSRRGVDETGDPA